AHVAGRRGKQRAASPPPIPPRLARRWLTTSYVLPPIRKCGVETRDHTVRTVTEAEQALANHSEGGAGGFSRGDDPLQHGGLWRERHAVILLRRREPRVAIATDHDRQLGLVRLAGDVMLLEDRAAHLHQALGVGLTAHRAARIRPQALLTPVPPSGTVHGIVG